MSKVLDNARKIRELLMKIIDNLSDADASTAPDMFPRLKEDGSAVYAGTRINWNGVIKKANVSLWDTNENNPDNAPDLWSDINYKEGYRIIPETITVTDMFAKDEFGWWGDELYRSKVDNNVYTPAQYADNWEIVGG